MNNVTIQTENGENVKIVNSRDVESPKVRAK
jgi:hypothetical protein